MPHFPLKLSLIFGDLQPSRHCQETEHTHSRDRGGIFRILFHLLSSLHSTSLAWDTEQHKTARASSDVDSIFFTLG